MFKDLPESLIRAALKLVTEVAPLDSCTSCGAVKGSCVHTDGEEIEEDAITKMAIPGEDVPEDELSGEKEDVVINPEYKSFRNRLPY